MLTAHKVWQSQNSDNDGADQTADEDGDGAGFAFRLATAGWTLGPMEDPAWLDQQLPTDFDALSGAFVAIR